MNNPIWKAGKAVGKLAAKESVDIGREAYAESKKTHAPLKDEVVRQARRRTATIRDEARAVALYLRKRPARAAVLVLSGVTAAAAFLHLKYRRFS